MVRLFKIRYTRYIREKADVITRWEAECRYYPITVMRKDSIKKTYDVIVDWLSRGKTGQMMTSDGSDPSV